MHNLFRYFNSSPEVIRVAVMIPCLARSSAKGRVFPIKYLLKFPEVILAQIRIVAPLLRCLHPLDQSIALCRKDNGYKHEDIDRVTGFTPKSRKIVDDCFTQFQWLSLMEKCRKQPTIC